jgi:peptidoglycan/xylan/chitin deacetylase (PgdA/CDA1 family)
MSAGSLRVVAAAGFTTVMWSLDSGDWRTTQPADVVNAVVGREVQPGSIVLFHDGQSWTVEALRTILLILKGAGHELVTVGELLGR